MTRTTRTLLRLMQGLVVAGLSLSLSEDTQLCAQSAPDTTQQASVNRAPGFRGVLFVSDFELDVQDITREGLLGGQRSGERPRPLQRRKQSDPATEAHQIIDSLATNLVADLNRAKINAQRLSPNAPMPGEGLIVRGVFTQVDEGNRVRRAVIGFGSGAMKMDLFVTVSDLAHPTEPLYSFSDKGTSGKMPGAVITMNPVVAAAKFTLDANSSAKALKNVAAQITAQILKGVAAAPAKAGN